MFFHMLCLITKQQLNPDDPAHQALWMQMDLSTGRKPDVRWRQIPGQPQRPGAPRCRLTSKCHLVTAGIPVFTMATVE